MTKVPLRRWSKSHASGLSRYALAPAVLATLLLALLCAATSSAQAPTYQRHRTGTRPEHRPHHPRYFAAPQIESQWYQRPYPYHLDYYRMKWGGSYEPYFGNLYGPPPIVVPPTYSPFPFPTFGPNQFSPIGPRNNFSP